MRERGLLEGEEYAHVAAGRIERADHRDQQQRPEIRDDSETDARRRHHDSGEEQQSTQSEAMRGEPDGQGENAGAQQRAGGDGSDFERAEPELDQIERQ